MATNDKEGLGEKVKEFFTQPKGDWDYEKAGGDDRVPIEQRTGDPKADAQAYAASNGEPNPYPDYAPADTND